MPKAKIQELLSAEPIADIKITPEPVAQLPVSYQVAKEVGNVFDRAMSNPKFDPKKMQAVLDMKLQWQRYQAEVAYNTAMADCQAELPHIDANCRNEHTKSSYANLEAIDTEIRPIYSKKYGFSLSFDTKSLGNNMINVICWVRHREGHKEMHELAGELDSGGFKGTANKTGIQAAGSSCSYLQRYLTKLIFNVIIKGEDKDGNGGKKPPKTDEFSEAMHNDAKANKKPVQTKKGPEATTAPQEDIPLDIRADNMLDHLGKLPTKEARVKLINANLPLLNSLVANGMSNFVDQMHKLADQGE